MLAAARVALVDHADDLVVLGRVQGGEGQVLQVPAEHLEPSRLARGQHLQGRPGRALLLVGRLELQGAHVVEPVGKLDDQHSEIERHGHDHLADGLGLGGVAELHLVELGHPVDQVGDLVAEVLAGLLQGVAGVLHCVVQQGRDQGGGVHAELGQDGRHRHRVGDERLPTGPLLAPVLPLGDLVGRVQQAHVGPGIAPLVGRDQCLERGLGALAVGEGVHGAGGQGPDTAAERPRLGLGLGGRAVRPGHLAGVRHGAVDLEAHRHLSASDPEACDCTPPVTLW